MRAQTGAFDKINFHGMTETGSFETLPAKIIFFSSALSSGSSLGELWAWKKQYLVFYAQLAFFIIDDYT